MNNNYFDHSPTPWEDVLTIRSKLSEFIKAHRLAHTLSVELQAIDMAKIIFPILGIDEVYLSDVSCAALLHDITKQMPMELHIELCKKYNIDIDYETENNNAMLHSKTAAFLAKDLFNVNECVFEAIYNHTVGSCDMDIISRIIFLADYIEPSRSADACKTTRELFYSSLNENHDNAPAVLNMCIIQSIDMTLKYLCEQNQPIHIQTVKTRNSILKEVQR